MSDAARKFDLAVRFAAFAGVGYFLYEFVKDAQAQEALDQQTAGTGIPKDWLNDPILQRDARNQLQTPQLYPRCQIFDLKYQFFLDTGDAESNASSDACFVKQAPIDNPRYLKDVSSDPLYQKADDPLQEDPILAGTCYFRLPDGTFQTFADFADPKNPLIPVNRSARLCFAAGETLQDAGYSFKNAQTQVTTFNPYYNVSELIDNAVLPGPPYCEQFDQESINSGTVEGWFYKNIFSNFTQSQCLSAGTADHPTRWRTSDLIIFTNPHTGEEVALKNEVY